jgi:hypothetical protein
MWEGYRPLEVAVAAVVLRVGVAFAVHLRCAGVKVNEGGMQTRK